MNLPAKLTFTNQIETLAILYLRFKKSSIFKVSQAEVLVKPLLQSSYRYGT